MLLLHLALIKLGLILLVWVSCRVNGGMIVAAVLMTIVTSFYVVGGLMSSTPNAFAALFGIAMQTAFLLVYLLKINYVHRTWGAGYILTPAQKETILFTTVSIHVCDFINMYIYSF